jgi:putative molybdopterin biosynthesis protein
MEDKVYTPDEVAKIFQISKHTVYELIKRGELNAFKIGNKMRIEQVELDQFKEKQKAPSQHQHATKEIDYPKPLRLAGSHDILVEQLIKHTSLLGNDIHIHPTYIGSLEGLMMLYRGHCDIAAIHLMDPTSQEYNLPFINQLFVHEKISLIRFATREQGLILPKGNPKKISKISDLARADIKFVNRQKGSGTRFLFDSLLAQEKISPKNITGYEVVEWNHLSAASYISRGAADVTFGIQAAANHLNLDFLPIAREQFDFVLKWTKENKETLTRLIEFLQSDSLRDGLKDCPGYDLEQLGTTIIDF